MNKLALHCSVNGSTDGDAAIAVPEPDTTESPDAATIMTQSLRQLMTSSFSMCTERSRKSRPGTNPTGEPEGDVRLVAEGAADDMKNAAQPAVDSATRPRDRVRNPTHLARKRLVTAVSRQIVGNDGRPLQLRSRMAARRLVRCIIVIIAYRLLPSLV